MIAIRQNKKSVTSLIWRLVRPAPASSTCPQEPASILERPTPLIGPGNTFRDIDGKLNPKPLNHAVLEAAHGYKGVNRDYGVA